MTLADVAVSRGVVCVLGPSLLRSQVTPGWCCCCAQASLAPSPAKAVVALALGSACGIVMQGPGWSLVLCASSR
jgi:hypothetical protein